MPRNRLWSALVTLLVTATSLEMTATRGRWWPTWKKLSAAAGSPIRPS